MSSGDRRSTRHSSKPTFRRSLSEKLSEPLPAPSNVKTRKRAASQLPKSLPVAKKQKLAPSASQYVNLSEELQTLCCAANPLASAAFVVLCSAWSLPRSAYRLVVHASPLSSSCATYLSAVQISDRLERSPDLLADAFSVAVAVLITSAVCLPTFVLRDIVFPLLHTQLLGTVPSKPQIWPTFQKRGPVRFWVQNMR